MKAQKGDLIRIVNAKTKLGHYKNGDIVEVAGRWGSGVIIDIDSPYNDIYDFEYVIHRKAGEEESCSNCGKQGVHTCRGAEYYAEQAEQDAVNSPQHYTQGRYEVIDIIEDAVQGADPFEAVCQANILKYTLRYRAKNGVEDLRKSVWYANRLIDYLDAKSTQ